MYDLILMLRETWYHMNNLECLLRNYALCVCVHECVLESEWVQVVLYPWWQCVLFRRQQLTSISTQIVILLVVSDFCHWLSYHLVINANI